MTISDTSSKTPFDLKDDEKQSMEEVLQMAADQESGIFSKGDLVQGMVIDTDREQVYLDIGKKVEGICPITEFSEVPAVGVEIPVVVVEGSQDGAFKLSHKEAERRVSWEGIREAFEGNLQLSGKIKRIMSHGYMVEAGGLELFLPMSHSFSKSGPRNKLNEEESVDFRILELKEKHRSAIISHRVVVEERNDASWAVLLEKRKVGDILEGVVTRIVSFGIFIRIDDSVEGLLHQSDISWKKFVKFKGKFKVGDTLKVMILTLDRDNNRLSLGLKQLGEDPWEWCKRELLVGSDIRGKVSSITDYGAFVEIREGLEGLVHVSELSWAKRVKHPRNYLKRAQEVEVRILAIDLEHSRISLGLKQLQEDPWANISTEVTKGDELEGEITSVAKFGAFVVIKENVEGLIHFSDYSWDDRSDKTMLKKGDRVKFRILDIDLDERRISCGIKQMTQSPYEHLRTRYKNGTVIECKIKNIAPFGLFVELEPGFEGLIHVSDTNLKQGDILEKHFKVGETVSAALQKIDVNAKKISLSIRAYEKKEDRKIIDQYMKKDDSPSTSSLGSFFKDLESNQTEK